MNGNIADIKLTVDNKNVNAKLEATIKKLRQIDKVVSSLGSRGLKTLTGDVNTYNSKLTQSNKSTKNLGDQAKRTAANMDNLGKSMKGMSNTTKLAGSAYLIREAARYFKTVTALSSGYIENLNLTEVAYNGNTKAVRELTNNMANILNLDESTITRQLGLFKQMFNAMQIPNDMAEMLSMNLTKLGTDVSSLYNVSNDRANSALMSALAGQTKPIRGVTGADITENTLSKTVSDLGLDRTVRELSFAEKRLVMIISLTKQLKNAQGDWARTIESPANQMKILTEQLKRAGRAIGNFFMPMVGAILPYLNAFLMVVTAVVNALALLIGFTLPEFDYSGLSGVGEEAMSVEDSLNGSSEAADKLKDKLSGLRGFDKLNVISTPSADSGSGAGGGAGGIDPKILAALSEYDMKMNGIKTKASEIAQKVLEWLGFTQVLNSETGLMEWKFTGIAGLDLEPLKESLANLYKAFTEFVAYLWEGVKWAYDNILVPLGAWTISEGLPAMIDVLSSAFKLLTDILVILAPWAKNIYENFIVPLAGVIGASLIGFLNILNGVLTDLSKWAKENPAYVQGMANIIIKFLAALWVYNSTKKIIAFLNGFIGGIKLLGLTLGIAGGNILMAGIVIGVLAAAIYVLSKNWSKMNGFERVIGVLGALAVVAATAAAAVGALQSAWSLGLAAVAIVAGIVAITAAIGSASKRAKAEVKGGAEAFGKANKGGFYASGGFPTTGEMFVARESGPEMVGTMGGRSAVANNDQIVEGIKKGVMEAMIATQGNGNGDATIIFKTDSGEIAKGVIKNFRDIARTNGQPIVIGG